MLPTRPLAQTGLRLTEIGFGAGPLGGFYGTVSAEEGAAAARRAYELGVRYFDVAPLYGHGRAELVLGHALRDCDRDSFVLSTKVGRYLVPAGSEGQAARVRSEGAPFNPVLDYSRDGVLRSIDQSLQRLGVARIDLVYIHDVDAHSQGSEEAAAQAFGEALRGALPALLELKEQGVIKAVGVGINQPRWAERWLREAPLDALMLAGRLTLLNREAEEGVLALCRARGVAYIAAGAFNGGMLARGTVVGKFNYRPLRPEVERSYDRLCVRASREGIELKAAALQYPLRFPEVASLVVVAESAAEVDENLRLAREPIGDAAWSAMFDPENET